MSSAAFFVQAKNNAPWIVWRSSHKEASMSLSLLDRWDRGSFKEESSISELFRDYQSIGWKSEVGFTSSGYMNPSV